MNFELSPEELELQQLVRAVATERLAPLAAEIEESEQVLPEVINALVDAELFRLLFPEAHGGKGPVSSVKICIVREELSRVSLVADTAFIMSGLGAYAIAKHGTPAQQRTYIPPLASGERLGSFALTEPSGGSDVGSMRTTARLDGDHWILNGSKRFSSGANAADTLIVFAKTDPDAGIRGISAFIVDKDAPGFAKRRMHLMYAHDVAELTFQDCRVPKDNLIGRPGDGATIALGNLTLFRPTLGASAVGSAQAALDASLRYAREREAFGKPIAGFQAIQFKLAEMATMLDAARLMVYRAAWLRDREARYGSPGGRLPVKEASMAKYLAAEVLRQVADSALRIHGGVGIVKGMEVERIYRQTHGALLGEGTPEIQLLTIAREMMGRDE